ncbi:MAG: DNA adenine methylase [Planctomycetaceae bacterium]|jgi:adenine-specific DNA-methyltransferase|nr:DNA adenine methylase [Planctomycetaceae bacterium]
MYSRDCTLKEIGEKCGHPSQEIQQTADIELTQLDKIANNEQSSSVRQFRSLDEFGDAMHLKLVEYSEFAINIPSLRVSESKILYGLEALFQNTIHQKPISLESRRYIGNKAKLTKWIMDLIDKETEKVNTFVDIFAGTASVSNQAIPKYKQVIINDILFSNNVIYKGFFEAGEWDVEKLNDIITYYNALDPDMLQENYFSKNFGGKFYEHNVAKLIGHIRQDIENIKSKLTVKEYNILLSTLIYNIDKLANTVGHFDAYIKKQIRVQQLHLRLINARDFNNVKIYRENANELAKRLKSDLVYIDPPYNSRQYNRFYHLYETLVKWDKPLLFGVALKPAPENNSLYCTTKARDAFEHLVVNLNTRFLVVSYNNTYNSKSHSSENKIRLEEIESILNKCGKTKIFECSHKFFNTGKTEFEDHKELLFITEVDDKRKNKSFSSVLHWR